MTKQRPLLSFFGVIFGIAGIAALPLLAIAGMVELCTERPDNCNPRYAHCEVHCGPEGMPEVERPSDPEPVVQDENGDSHVNFDAMV